MRGLGNFDMGFHDWHLRQWSDSPRNVIARAGSEQLREQY